MISRGSFIEVEKLNDIKENAVKVYFRGSCLENCEVGEEVKIKTVTGHIISGIVSSSISIFNKLTKSENDVKEIYIVGRSIK